MSAAARGMIDVLADSTQNPRTPDVGAIIRVASRNVSFRRSGLSLILVGMLRGDAPMQVLSGPIGREHVHYEAPPRDRLDSEMDRFLAWFDRPEQSNNTLRACLAHLWFETLHPFEDGNGRLGRAVFDLALAQGAKFHPERISR